jgi:hypothetical protein
VFNSPHLTSSDINRIVIPDETESQFKFNTSIVITDLDDSWQHNYLNSDDYSFIVFMSPSLTSNDSRVGWRVQYLQYWRKCETQRKTWGERRG